MCVSKTFWGRVSFSHLIEFHRESPVVTFSVDGLNRGSVTVYLPGVTDGVPGVIEAGGVEDFRVVTLNRVGVGGGERLRSVLVYKVFS